MSTLLHTNTHSCSSPLDQFFARAEIFTGREAILSRARAMEELGGRSGQLGAMHGLSLLLNREYTARKLPHLICLHTREGELLGAVLLFEYRLSRWPTGLLASGDQYGVRTVIADGPMRFDVAAVACRAMLARGAGAAMVSFKWPGELPADIGSASCNLDSAWAIRTRVVRDFLPLAATVDETMARLGKRTRTHLRYYRRRFEKAVPCDFVSDAGTAILARGSLLLARLNRGSLNPMPQTEFDLQFEAAANLPGGFVSGLRTKDGSWLSLVGGWRHGGTTWVQWQTNAAGYEELSLGTVLRSYLIEVEVDRGTTRLAFHGGTSHTMSHAFPPEQVIDLLAVRPGTIARQATRLVPWIYRRLPKLEQRGNLLGDVVRSDELRWFNEGELAAAFGWTGAALSAHA